MLTTALLGIAAMAVVGLRTVAERIHDDVREQRAGEAAVAAAGAAVGELQFARVTALGHELDREEVAAFVADPAVTEAARTAATELARLHGLAAPSDVRVLAFGFEIEIHVMVGRRAHVALLGSNP